QGRFIQESDRPGAPPVAVINRTLAERRFPDRDPIGEHLTIWSDSREIVGVVADMRQTLFPRLGGGSEEAIYISLLRSVPRNPYLLLRTRGDPLMLAEPVRRMIWGLDPDIPINTMETLDDFMRRYAGVTEVFNWILGAFGILALLLASLGTYGVVAYSVGQRTQEVGVRLAVGARPREVVGMITRQGLWMSIVGIVVGGIILIPVLAAIRNVVAGFGVGEVDPVTLAVVIATLFVVTLVATVVPATRAATVDPVRVLKAE
ncbi:FtsX-like permease family protein, partial [Gemmatimonadota bacterium]